MMVKDGGGEGGREGVGGQVDELACCVESLQITTNLHLSKSCKNCVAQSMSIREHAIR